MTKRRSATDHRAVVLESVATAPAFATNETVVADAAAIGWTDRQPILTMVSTLCREGLIGRREDGRGYFVTSAGLNYLQLAAFDRKLPEYAPRPGSRKPRTK